MLFTFNVTCVLFTEKNLAMKAIKRILYVAMVLAILIVGALGVLYSQFNNYEPIDNFPAKAENLSYFNNSYTEARASFKEQTAKLKEQYPTAQEITLSVPCETDNDLTIDLFFLPQSNKSEKLIILSSGVHGVEGHTGSAVQRMFMDKFVSDSLLANSGLLLVHAVNPYGFKYDRRVTENNVDMNRNSDVSEKLYETVNEGYPQVFDLVNPQEPLNHGSFANNFFFAKAITAIAKKSMPVLRQAVLQGQYQFPKGLYFGGNKAEPQITLLKPVLDSICAPYPTVAHFALHTGFGARGVMHLFPNPKEGKVRVHMENLFEGYQIDWGDSGDFYTVTGDFVNFVNQVNSDKLFIPMALEFGTMDSQTTMGSLKSIQIMILENQGMQHGYKGEQDKVLATLDIIEMYYPSSNDWRSYVIEQSNDFFELVLPRFAETDFAK